MATEKATSQQKATIAGLARTLGRLPSDKKLAALESSAAIAGVSLKASREFVEAVPKAAKLLSADELRQWAELGRRLAMGSADTGAQFFAGGVDGFEAVPENARHIAFEICTRQLVLSSSTALETFRILPELAEQIGNDALLTDILELGRLVAQRSAKHSADLIAASGKVANALSKYGSDSGRATAAAVKLGGAFAERTGGMAAEFWSDLPDTLAKIDASNAVDLLESAVEVLDLGGSVTMHFVASGGDVLSHAPQTFDNWTAAVKAFAKHGNAVLIAFLRATPGFLRQIVNRRTNDVLTIRRVLDLVVQVANVDAESALAAFRSSVSALDRVSVEQYSDWVASGLISHENESGKARKSYFALETRESNSRLLQMRIGLPLERVRNILRIYIEGLTGKAVEIEPMSAISGGSRIGDGKTIHVPATVAEFDDDERDFRLYKVLAAHGAGQIEFGTFLRDTDELKAAYTELKELYSATADQIDAFSLSGYIEDVQKGESALPHAETRAAASARRQKLPPNSDYKAVLNLFPEPKLARRIFGTIENARIDAMLRTTYRGLRGDLDLMQGFLRENRPYIFDVPMHQVPFELLFQITLCGGASDDARMFYGQVVSEIESVIERFFFRKEFVSGEMTSSVADSLIATSRIYSLFQNISPDQDIEAEPDNTEEDAELSYDDTDAAESVMEDRVQREREKSAQDISDLFNAWNSLDDEGEPDELSGAEAWSQNDMPEQALEDDDIAFAYDEWDRDLGDHRIGWSRVIEKKVKLGDRTFVELTRSRYRGVISSIRHQFQLMKPENLTRINREIDGEDHDLNALVDYVIDRRADGLQSENIYTKRLRKQRDVAVSLLLDQSSSTARTITRNPLQPYTHPGRRIIEIEKEGLVLMSEALEAVGDIYSINGFTSEGRRNVKFYVVKDFHEKYNDEVEKRIGGITFQNNTRLGAAIRHASHKLLRQESRTKLLIILTDGRPYDHDYGDARYAREDVREALTEAKISGVTPFCITIDRESEAELKELYGNVGYTIIDDVLSLPERMPNIYRRLTS